METITIPSPSAFLSSPLIKPEPKPPPPSRKPRPTSPTKLAAAQKKQADGVKPKQSKSRNGCVTCKTKRLKCDETKPACQQCHKRSVTCGGYKKDFKWRPFEEATFVNKVVPARTKRRTSSAECTRIGPEATDSISAKTEPKPLLVASSSSSDASPTPGADGNQDVVTQDSFFNAAAPTPPMFSPQDIPFADSPVYDMNTSPYVGQPLRPKYNPDSITSTLSSLFEDTPVESPRPSLSGQSPRLIDLLLPGSELNARPGTVSVPPIDISSPAMDIPSLDPFSMPDITPDAMLDEDVEEIIRGSQLPEADLWMDLENSIFDIPPPSPAQIAMDERLNRIFRQPEVQAGSPEMLMLRFDKQTCGILSVKDGPTENPWRTLVWPLARDSPALYHAIASMTAFHTSKEKPALRVDGMEHMRRSIRSLATGIEKMRTDTALATTLVLAFSESWDQHISTGIEHLRGARILVNQALVQHNKRKLTGDDLTRLKFLCNTWVYMDVIARLTSVDDNSSNDVDQAFEPFNPTSNLSFSSAALEVDPLLGCAATLFPLIGSAANLCRRVLRLPTNSIPIISQAMEIKAAIEAWQAPPSNLFERPEDPTSEIQHALQTAEAYRYATLLYLHQAVPEIPSLTSAQLAKKVLVYLATVPISSRLVIVQIYPLLAAGCEASEAEDRLWIEERWLNMARRMCIGNIDRCWEVMQEVWARRDAVEAERAARESLKRPAGVSAGMVYSESSKRRFEEELALEGAEGFSFEELLHSNSLGGVGGSINVGLGMGSKKQRTSSFGGFVRSERVKRDERLELVTEEIEEERTVRGRLHWVGVMRDWDWEILLG